MIQLTVETDAGVFDATTFADQISISGDYQSISRVLEFGLLTNSVDRAIPMIDCSLGAKVVLSLDGAVLFRGKIFTRTRKAGESLVSITAIDDGIRLNRNQGAYKVENMTPEAMVRRICADYGFTPGEIAETGVKLNRKFLCVSLKDMIQTLYTKASEQTGKKYVVRFDDGKLCVVERSRNVVCTLTGDYNLQSASMTESAENMTNQVVIYDQGANQIQKPLKNQENIDIFGVLQSAVSQGDDAVKTAEQMLKDGDVSQKITVTNFGDARCVTGNSVIVHEPVTGVDGLFYIDNDVHTWSNGIYTNQLTLNFKEIMSESNAGEE
ncbi:MAG: hypothetical protein KHZ62_08465 [Clostridiales bacterium]|nr:hypothetical protein [Clostridiales bacterium]